VSRWLGMDDPRGHLLNVRPLKPYDRMLERDDFTNLCLSVLIAEGLSSDKPAVLEAARHLAGVTL